MADLDRFVVRNEAEEVGGNGSCARGRMDEALRRRIGVEKEEV